MSNLIERKKINPNQTMKSFPLLAIEQFERLVLSHNVEFRGGFYMQTNDKEGGIKEIYVADTREVFCNTCKALAILIGPRADKRTVEAYKKLDDELKALMQAFLDASSVEESIILGESFYQKEEDKILLEEYNNKKVEIHQRMFEVLCNEFHQHRFWAKSSIDD